MRDELTSKCTTNRVGFAVEERDITTNSPSRLVQVVVEFSKLSWATVVPQTGRFEPHAAVVDELDTTALKKIYDSEQVWTLDITLTRFNI